MKGFQKILLVTASAVFLTAQANAIMYFARPYDPNLQRWLTRDPLGDQGSLIRASIKFQLSTEPTANYKFVTGPLEAWDGVNLYSHVENNPISRVDPLGLSGVPGHASWDACGGGGGVGGDAGWEAASAEELAMLRAQAQAEAAEAAAARARGDAPKARDLMGMAAKDIAKMLEDMGWKGTPTRTPGGMRYVNPNKPGEQVRIMPGNPNDPNPAKQGPYARVSTCGNVSDPIPISK